VTRRTTVADVVVDGLRRAGTPCVIGIAGAELPVLAAARAIDLPVALASSASGACVIAAVSGDLVDAPGAAVIGGEPTAAAIRSMPARAPVILITSGHGSAAPGFKETLRVETESAAHRIAHAARLAMTEPRGPVHLDIPDDVTKRAALPLATSCRPDPLPYPAREGLDRAARALSEASRPLLLVGAHCRSAEAAQWLRALVEALPAPVLTTARAKGALPDPHPLMLGVLGAGGVEERLLGRADLVVLVGLDALEPVPERCWSAVPAIVFGPTAAADGRVPAVQVLGEVSAVVEELAGRLRDKPRADWDVAELDRLRREGATRSAGLDARVVRLAREATPAGTIATVDAGADSACVAAAWSAVAPREFLAPSGVATSGFALPAAIAAHLVHPDRRVVCFTGVSELGAESELATAARVGARIAIVGFEADGMDSAPAMRQAERFEIPACAVEGEATFAQALGRALTTEGSSLIVVRAAQTATIAGSRRATT
jgi:acetolactate synthase-1/2/3 large subunit